MLMPRIDVDADVLFDALSTDEIVEELERRAPEGDDAAALFRRKPILLEQIFQHYRGRADCPECLREYIYLVLGRIV